MRVRQHSQSRWPGAVALVAGLLLAACGGGGSPTASSPPPATSGSGDSPVLALDASNFEGVVATGVSLVDFYHPGCSHCRAMEPVVERLATDFEGQAVVGKVNVTTDQALAAAWGVRAYPTFIVVKDGQQHGEWLGETTYERLAGMIRAALNAP